MAHLWMGLSQKYINLAIVCDVFLPRFKLLPTRALLVQPHDQYVFLQIKDVNCNKPGKPDKPNMPSMPKNTQQTLWAMTKHGETILRTQHFSHSKFLRRSSIPQFNHKLRSGW